MPKTRTAIPKAIRERVFNEFNHRCAIGGEGHPHIHHIDGDNSNNAEQNLIPLCPNHHLTDLHNPTQPINPDKLGLFRRFKDPTILRSEFDPLFKRAQFLFRVDGLPFHGDQTGQAVNELIEFVKALEMGQFYASRLKELMSQPGWGYFMTNEPEWETRERNEDQDNKFQQKLIKNRDDALTLLVELLRYQRWSSGNMCAE